MSPPYVVLGDVVSSRDATDRAALGERLADGCDRVTDRFETVAPFEPLKGVDEFGGVLPTPASAYDVTLALRAALRPERVRVAVVGGEVDVGLETGRVARMDGPAFHRADELLAGMDAAGRTFAFESAGGSLDTLVTDEVNLLLARRRSLTDRQREVIRAYRDHGTQRAAAEALDVTQQAVSKALRAADWRLVAGVEERLRGVLARYET